MRALHVADQRTDAESQVLAQHTDLRPCELLQQLESVIRICHGRLDFGMVVSL